MVVKTAITKFGMSARNINAIPASVNARPKSRRREKPRKVLGPRPIPPASPRNTAPNKTPYAASPPPKSPTNVLANPTTAPPAAKAPSMPTIKPRMTFVWATYFQPSIKAFITLDSVAGVPPFTFGIS